MTDYPYPSKKQVHSLWRKVVALVVTAPAIGWVVLLLWRTWPDFSRSLGAVEISPLVIALLLVVVASYLIFEAFRLLVSVAGISGLGRLELGHLHFTSQLLKHLPGRVWGIGYQIASGRREGTVGAWLLANVCHMGLAVYFALLTSSLVLLGLESWSLGVAVAFAGAAVYYFVWKTASTASLRELLERLPGGLSTVLLKATKMLGTTPIHIRWILGLLFVGSWIAMYVAWILFALAFPGTVAADGARLLAIYMIAWFIGYVTLVAPSGLGVRELAFAMLATGFDSNAIVFMGLVGRFSLLSSDLLLGLLFSPFAPHRKLEP